MTCPESNRRSYEGVRAIEWISACWQEIFLCWPGELYLERSQHHEGIGVWHIKLTTDIWDFDTFLALGFILFQRDDRVSKDTSVGDQPAISAPGEPFYRLLRVGRIVA